MLVLLNEPSFIRNIGDRGVRTLDQARAYIADGPVASYARHGFGLYLVELKEPRTPIGICGVLKRDVLPEPDIGFAFLPATGPRATGWSRRPPSRTTPARRSACRASSPSSIRRTRTSIRLLEKLGFSLSSLTKLGPDAPEVKLYTCNL